MNVEIDDTFAGISCADYEHLYFDEPFNESIGQALKMGRKLLHFKRTADRVVRHVCYEPNRDPDSPAGKAFGKSRASFVEELDYDVHARRGEWRTIPNMMPDRVRNAGTIEILEAPDNSARRVVRAEVVVTLFGFGRLVERMIVAEIKKSYASTAELTNAWIARRSL
jgi:hypothetical protein